MKKRWTSGGHSVRGEVFFSPHSKSSHLLFICLCPAKGSPSPSQSLVCIFPWSPLSPSDNLVIDNQVISIHLSLPAISPALLHLPNLFSFGNPSLYLCSSESFVSSAHWLQNFLLERLPRIEARHLFLPSLTFSQVSNSAHCGKGQHYFYSHWTVFEGSLGLRGELCSLSLQLSNGPTESLSVLLLLLYNVSLFRHRA